MASLHQKINRGNINTRGQMWNENLCANVDTIKKGDNIKELKNSYKGCKAIVVAAGPTMHTRGIDELHYIYNNRYNTAIIACDGALPVFREAKLTPDFIVSGDGSSIVAKFYQDKLRGEPTTIFLNTTVSPATRQIIEHHGYKITWWQSMFEKQLKDLTLKNIPSFSSGGNVGTTCWVLAQYLGFSPIGLLGIELSWSDDTPYGDTQYYEKLYEIYGGDVKKIKSQYASFYNPYMNKRYIADPVYYYYMTQLKEMYEAAPPKVRKNTFTLTPEGIVCKTGIKYKSIEEFIK